VAAVTFRGTLGVAATLIYYNCRDEKGTRSVKNPGEGGDIMKIYKSEL
jgi:hypothetical protein